MPKIFPFTCYRPAKNFAQKFTRKPSDFTAIERSEGIEKLLNQSVFSIAQPELFGRSFQDGINQYSSLIKRGLLFPELNPSLYLYKISTIKTHQIGLVCEQPIEDLLKNRLKRHEKTRKRGTSFLTERTQQLKLNFNPVFTFFNNFEDEFIELVTPYCKLNVPQLSFKTINQEDHTIWNLNHSNQLTQKLIKLFSAIDYTFLADGHHRLQVLQNILSHKDRFTTILFPQKQLKTYSYSKVFRGIDIKRVDKAMAVLFDKSESTQRGLSQLELYRNKKWETLFFNLDALALNNYLANEWIPQYLGISDYEADERILFFKNKYGKHAIEVFLEHSNFDFAITAQTIPVRDIQKVASKDDILPPKSTIFYPKPRAGLFITRLLQ